MSATTAKLVQELVEYDGPQLLLLKTDRHHMLAVAVKRTDMEEPFFSCEVNEKNYQRYFSQIADLHFLFERALGKRYYFFDLAKITDARLVKLRTASTEEAKDHGYWPNPGFFSRSHTTNFNLPAQSGETRTFKIDGRWRTNDFSHFHSKMADLYALFGVLNRISKAPEGRAERGFIRDTIIERLWQGGGSYVGFYDALFFRNKNLHLSPLEVAKIQYASPGELVLRGDSQSLADVSDIIEVFQEKWRNLSIRYNYIHGILKQQKMLRAKPTKKFSSDRWEQIVLTASRTFADEMEIEHVDDILVACDDTTLVFAKVILSIFRRANELFLFYAEGRVQRVD